LDTPSYSEINSRSDCSVKWILPTFSFAVQREGRWGGRWECLFKRSHIRHLFSLLSPPEPTSTSSGTFATTRSQNGTISAS